MDLNDLRKVDPRVLHAQRVERALGELRAYGGIAAVERALAIHKTSPVDIFDAIALARAEVATNVRRDIAAVSGRTLAEVFSTATQPTPNAPDASQPNRRYRRAQKSKKGRR